MFAHHLPSASEKQRQSNFELLRIVAMLLVMVVHADFFSLSHPDAAFIASHPAGAYMRYLVEAMALVCVNVFVLVSGYFGIRPNARRVANFLFMVLFYQIGIVLAYVGYHRLTGTPMAESADELLEMCRPLVSYWFVAAYLILMCLAPILNRFIANSTPRQLWTFALCYWILELYFGYYTDTFSAGYGALAFINLYVIGAAVKKTPGLPLKSALAAGTAYLGICALTALIMLAIVGGIDQPQVTTQAVTLFIDYTGINVMLASVALFLFFKHLKINSKAVNFVAGSAFAIYLLHMHPLLCPTYREVCRELYFGNSLWPYLGKITAFIAAIFAAALLIDQVRKLLWRLICRLISRLFGQR